MASSTVIATLDTSVRIPWVVTLLAMTLGVVVGFRLQRRHQHPPRSEPCDLIQLKKLLACFPSSSTLYYLQHRWRLLPPGSHRGSRCLRGRVRAAFFIAAPDPQLSVITLLWFRKSLT